MEKRNCYVYLTANPSEKWVFEAAQSFNFQWYYVLF